MSERPILFSGPMVRAILAGTKTQTRRVVKGRALEWLAPDMFTPEYVANPENYMCPYGVAGDRLWVREAWQVFVAGSDDLLPLAPGGKHPGVCSLGYAATEDERVRTVPQARRFDGPWRHPFFMPRWASRITLEVAGVRVERLQEISEEDAQAEGIRGPLIDPELDRMVGGQIGVMPREAFAKGWDTINGKRRRKPDPEVGEERVYSWASNPWVWVVSFSRIYEGASK